MAHTRHKLSLFNYICKSVLVVLRHDTACHRIELPYTVQINGGMHLIRTYMEMTEYQDELMGKGRWINKI